MALNEILNGKTVQNLIDDDTFITALVPKLTAGDGNSGVYTKTAADTALAGKANVAGDNLLPAFVTALAAGAGDSGVYTKTAADATLATKANTAALADKLNVDGTNISDVFVTALTTGGTSDNRVYTKTEANTALAGKANVAGDNLLPAFVTALAAGAGDSGVYTKTQANTALAGKANVAGDNLLPAFVTALAAGAGDSGVYTKTAADATLATKANTAALADKLNVDGSNILTQQDKGKALMDVLVPALATGDKDKGIYTKEAADTAFVKAKELATKVAEKAVVDAIFDAKDGDKSILVDKLGEFLIKDDTKAYDNGNKTAKELLVPSAADLVQDQSFKKDIDTSIKEMAVSNNSDFQKSVREVMSQPHFDIPESNDAALNWTW